VNDSAMLRDRSRLLDVRLWVAAALLVGFLLRLGAADGASKLWFFDPLLLGGFWLAAGRLEKRSDRSRFGGLRGAAMFVGISWLSGMLYELALSTGGGWTFGGMHPETLPSFVLAQGFYIPYAIFGYLLVRRTDVSFRTLFFAAGAVSVFEMLLTGRVASGLVSPFFALVPLLVAYYVSVYAMIICWPVAIFGLERFRVEAPRHVSARRAVGLMLAAGGACWLIFGAWGVLLEHLAPGFVSR
jgi:hypothetical protein